MGSVLGMLLMKHPDDLVTDEYQTEYDIPLPKILHKTITEEEIQGKKVLIVGDVHGCLDELKALLQKANALNGNTLIIFCGDVINKGPKNIETLNFIRSIGAYTVRGNHEESVMNHWLKLKKNSSYRNVMKPKLNWITGLVDNDIDYLLSLPYTISVPSLNCLIVHGGLDPWKPLHRQQPENMTGMRNIVEPDSLSPKLIKRLDDGLAWASLWLGPQHVYFGHDARRGLQFHKYATGLDTGCVYGKQLTAVLIHPKKEIITVDSIDCYRDPLKLILKS